MDLDDNSRAKKSILLAYKMYSHIWSFIHNDVEYIVLNYFVAYIPLWTVRKILYSIFGMKIGKKSRIAMRVVVLNPRAIEIGERNVINEFVLLDGRSGLKIGSDNSISMYVKIYSGTHDSNSNTFAYRGGGYHLKRQLLDRNISYRYAWFDRQRFCHYRSKFSLLWNSR